MIPLVDLHTHVLQGVDDGSPDLETSLAMLDLAYQDGIRTLCCTPHFHPARELSSSGAEAAFAALSQAAAERFPDLTLCLASEIYYHTAITDSLSGGKCRPLGDSRLLLIEFDPDVEERTLIASLRALHAKGYVPVLAHVERYACVRNKPELLHELREWDVIMQMNASVILGKYGSGSKRFAKKAIAAGLIDLVASDAHDPIHRPPMLSEAYRYVAKKFGQDTADAIFHHTPLALLGIKA